MKFRFFTIILLLVGSLVGYFSGYTFLYPDKDTFFNYRLGLDLQGGVHLVYKADTSSIKSAEISESMEGLRDVIERRVNMFGVAEPIIQIERQKDEMRLIVELAGVTNVADAIKMIGETPYLEFKKETPEEIRKKAQEEYKEGDVVDDSLYYEATELTGRYLKKATLEFDQTTFEPIIGLEFTKEGRDIFAEITRNNIGKTIAIYLDGVAITAPRVNEEITGGKAQISGQFTAKEAKALVRNLNAGALPIPIELIFQQSIGASLGGDALERGIRAGIYGVVLVAIFLILWYRALGFAAVVALSIYIAILLAIFKLMPITLTAAGIAGFILSIGVAVDANILIFERFKEEAQSGKNIKYALREGFKRGWTSIRDSNLSSLITATILYWFSTSLVKGFALTLGIGIVVSLLSALFITRTFLFAISIKKTSLLSSFLFGSGFKNIPRDNDNN